MLRNTDRSPSTSASSMKCVVSSIVRELWGRNIIYIQWKVENEVAKKQTFSSCSSVHVSLLAPGSIPLVGSSRRTISDPPIKAIASDSLRFWPPAMLMDIWKMLFSLCNCTRKCSGSCSFLEIKLETNKKISGLSLVETTTLKMFMSLMKHIWSNL